MQSRPTIAVDVAPQIGQGKEDQDAVGSARGQRRSSMTSHADQLPSPRATPPNDSYPMFANPSPTTTDTDPVRERQGKRDTGLGLDIQHRTGKRRELGEGTYSSDAAPESRDEEIWSAPAALGDSTDAASKPTILSAENKRSHSTSTPTQEHVVRGKLSASEMQALTASPESLPVAIVPTISGPGPLKPNGSQYPLSAGVIESRLQPPLDDEPVQGMHSDSETTDAKAGVALLPEPEPYAGPSYSSAPSTAIAPSVPRFVLPPGQKRPSASRTVSTPPVSQKAATSAVPNAPPKNVLRNSGNPSRAPQLNLAIPLPHTAGTHRDTGRSNGGTDGNRSVHHSAGAPVQPTFPLPPMSLSTHLQLELAGVRPSPLYVYQHHVSDVPYESSAVKFERLLNALLLPWYLETALTFGALACLDAFLHIFTLLPLRFFISIGELVKWWASVAWKEVDWLVAYVWQGVGRLWRRGRGVGNLTLGSGPNGERSVTASAASDGERSRSQSRSREHGHVVNSNESASRLNVNGGLHPPRHALQRTTGSGHRHQGTKSWPSTLSTHHKAVLLQGAIIIVSSLCLMSTDASRMYHFIRAQSAMKLYVIYNLLEVGDRLLGAIGQDILECLFSSETLSRNSLGRSKLLLPLGMFTLALIYNVAHAVCLFYQVITLNVAVNSYSNALLTLIMSNQFVEIKGSVFKKIEKENLFQLTCADVVERFQLWVILVIIGMRNIVEVGGLSVPGAGSQTDASAPLRSATILPASFTLLPSWMMSGEVLSPFLVVIGSEMLVDWIKHAYINKFNNMKPKIYERMLDILCKDYYTNAFSAPTLTRRIGLPLMPLSCLFIRASVQVYHMFLATRLAAPLPTSTKDLLLESSVPSSPAMRQALDHLDHLIRTSLGRAVYGIPHGSPHRRLYWSFSADDVVAFITMFFIFFLAWLVLLVIKLLLGMVLLKYARNRYAAVRKHEAAVNAGQAKRESFFQPGKRVGGWGQVELGDERRRILYADDVEGLHRMRERDRKGGEMSRNCDIGPSDGLDKVERYEMVAKRIW